MKTETAVIVQMKADGQFIHTGEAELQLRLNALGYARSTPNGVFGPETEQDVRDFQQTQGLIVDGIAGTQTRSALDATYRTWGIQAVRASTASSYPRAVRELQRRLSQLGYYSGTIDGV